jgi:mono/diheme cytochrome c family protein
MNIDSWGEDMKTAISGILIITALVFGSYAHAAEVENHTSGKQLYRNLCASCHGISMEGDGPLARTVYPAPASLHHAVNEHSTMGLMHKIMHGEGMMPAWYGVLSPEQVRSVISYIKQEAEASEEQH